MDDWLDISKAPTDGTRVLVRGPINGEAGKGTFLTIAHTEKDFDGEWFDENDEQIITPTHFSKIPVFKTIV